MLIAHTQERVVLTGKKPGDRVNVEFDVVAKGVESIVSNILSGGSSDGQGSAFEELVDRAVERALARRGLLK